MKQLMEAIMKPKRISKKVAMQSDENMLNYHYQQLDKAHCISWHRATGMFVEDWCNYLEKYAKARGRGLFFATNEWNVPCCYFDATNEKEWLKYMRDTRRIQKRWAKIPVKYHWPNPEIADEGTRQ